MTKSPFLVVSYAIPNRATGTPVVIRKFLENFSSEEVVLIGRPTKKKERIKDINFHYPTYVIPTPPVGFRGEKLWRFLSVFFGTIVGLIAILIHKPKAILAFYRDESSLLTGYILHKLTQLPLYSYFCDIYLENFDGGYYQKLAAWLQPRIFCDSKKVIVLTEAMRKYFHEKYDIEPVVLPHCNNDPIPDFDGQEQIREVCRIGYLGGINVDRVKSLKVLAQAINGNPNYHLTYFTPVPEEKIREMGLFFENSDASFIPDNEHLMIALSTCDILFLPLALDDDNEEREIQVKTGFPTKAIEYLSSQVPILIHSDKGSFCADFFGKYQCAYVLHSKKIDEMQDALKRLCSDKNLREKLLKNSKPAISYFSGEEIANSFRNLIQQ
jgi:glycosyltransferase involved in cell wall biosynthesis